MFFPYYRPRRMRKTSILRKLFRETSFSVDDLIYPLFVVNGSNIKSEIKAIPGQYHLSIDNLIILARQIFDLGINAVILFGIPSRKDAFGRRAYSKDGIIQRAVKELKNSIPELIIITDVCLCQYTDHGHCGLVDNGYIDNDLTLDVIANIALSHVEAGSDIVAPSDMMDGRVAKIRENLDNNGYINIPIMSYSVKYSSFYYGPFRTAVNSAPTFADRRTYQMDPGNSREAIREAFMDVNEGADIIMVKPALSYLDIIYRVRKNVNLPIVAYNVSGEYSMIKSADKLGFIDGDSVMLETILSIKRAGADAIITYFALDIAKTIAK